MDLRHKAFALAFRSITALGADRWGAGFAQGCGVILTLHRVCETAPSDFSPNRILDVTPAFLDTALTFIRDAKIDLVTMDEAARRIASPVKSPFFVALTFDDGFRDTLDVALPVLRKHQAPACVYVVPGFAERTAPLWWLDLEAALQTLAHVELQINGMKQSFNCSSTHEKCKAYNRIYWQLRAKPEAELRACIAELAQKAGHDSHSLVARLCLDWAGIKSLSQDRLITIGAHTMTHPRLARISGETALDEIQNSKLVIESHIGQPVDHFAYPVGDEASAGSREFGMAEKAGFTTAVTTRPGHVFTSHKSHLQALPRVSLNGLHQNIPALRAIVSGLPFWALNRGRKLNVE